MNKEQLHEKIEFSTVRELVEWAGDTWGEDTAFSFRPNPHDETATEVSYTALRGDVRALASALLSMGCAGKHCVVIGKMSYDWALLYYAILSIGAVIVPLDPEWNASDLADTAAKADSDFLFIEESLKEKAVVIENACALSHPPVFMSTKDTAAGVNELVEGGRALYEENPDAYHTAEIDANALALLVFTSGTTGKGKGVMLSQNAVLSDIADVIPYIDYSRKTVSVLPPHHTFGSTVMLLGHVIFGCNIYISSGLRYVQKELKEQKPGHLILVPLYLETFYRKILATVKEQGKEKLLFRMIAMSNGMRRVGIDMRKKLFASVRDAFGGEVHMAICGGAPLNPEIISFFESIGISTLNGYGITECAPIVAVNRSRHVVDGSVGTVFDIDTVKIEDPNEDGEGEICVMGPNVMLGYYKDEAATAEAIDEDGYFHTGDYGKLDKDNILYITGRKKNLIILSNGKNVYPEEIENELIATPGILDVIVYEGQSKRGVMHNAIVAEVFPDKDYIEKNGITDIKAHLQPYINEYNRNAVPYKKIKILKVRAKEFPKNTLRKIMRFQLDTTID
ncbi:MAG: AMP-binding protein [Clostridia bacterium]|nr:AMP-binding protein [Clostridia bacterium]